MRNPTSSMGSRDTSRAKPHTLHVHTRHANFILSGTEHLFLPVVTSKTMRSEQQGVLGPPWSQASTSAGRRGQGRSRCCKALEIHQWLSCGPAACAASSDGHDRTVTVRWSRGQLPRSGMWGWQDQGRRLRKEAILNRPKPDDLTEKCIFKRGTHKHPLLKGKEKYNSNNKKISQFNPMQQ